MHIYTHRFSLIAFRAPPRAPRYICCRLFGSVGGVGLSIVNGGGWVSVWLWVSMDGGGGLWLGLGGHGRALGETAGCLWV
jgi:hypothetical protein